MNFAYAIIIGFVAVSMITVVYRFEPNRVLATVRHTARHSLRLFATTGVLDVPGGREAFETTGLLTGRTP